MNIFKKAQQKAKNFLDATKKELKKTKSSFVKEFKRKYTDKKTKESLEAGNLLTFEYNAIDKTEKYDKRPFIVSLGQSQKNKKHILGLNLHHIKSESQRVLLASLIVEMLEKKKKLYYKDVKSLIKKFEGSPILRQYAVRRISQKVIRMPQEVYLRAATFTQGDFSS